jgi:hypothetical protein
MASFCKGHSLITFGHKPRGNEVLTFAQVLRHFEDVRMVFHDLYKLFYLWDKKLLMKLLPGAQGL